jgi:hypothetical protein
MDGSDLAWTRWSKSDSIMVVDKALRLAGSFIVMVQIPSLQKILLRLKALTGLVVIVVDDDDERNLLVGILGIVSIIDRYVICEPIIVSYDIVCACTASFAEKNRRRRRRHKRERRKMEEFFGVRF